MRPIEGFPPVNTSSAVAGGLSLTTGHGLSNQRRVAVASVTTLALIANVIAFAFVREQSVALVAAWVTVCGGWGISICALCLVGRIRAQNQELRRLDALKDDFVASVSHELRTPLTSIRGYLELVLDGEVGELTDAQRRYLSVVDRNADTLLRVVGDLLFAAQVDAGEIALDCQRTDFDQLVQEAVEAARPLVEEHDIEIEVEAGGVGELTGDRARLAQILDNHFERRQVHAAWRPASTFGASARAALP